MTYVCYHLIITDLNLPKISLSRMKVMHAVIRILSSILVSYDHFRESNHWFGVVQKNSVSFVDIPRKRVALSQTKYHEKGDDAVAQ
jgi:hypothetical protein